MIEKIISGGQTGADRAALDTAIKFDVPHGGFVPKGRLAEDGPLPERYLLEEVESENYALRTERNVLESDGTLILSHGELTGGSLLTRRLCEQHGKPCLHLDLQRTDAFAAARDTHAWMLPHTVRTLNVAGPRASGDPKIYSATVDVLETLLYLDTSYESMKVERRPGMEPGALPGTVEEAVGRLLDGLGLRERVSIAKQDRDFFLWSNAGMARDIARKYGLFTGNTELLASCAAFLGRERVAVDVAARGILGALWDALRESHALRRVK
jgi:hypothetical protein